ncbi:MAG TPA: DUF4159 domain-containing protein [Stellaceae bacterium]|jgi:hypothetical protein|nr:DUF4159 domain-containing protein [Stellaceae bacterium]
MLALGSLAFASPWLLVALAALPIIWWLLRVTPPAPRRIAFPAIRLLLGLVPREETPARTPLWLILLRMALAALVIVAAAHPLLNPQARLASTGPILVIVDDGWTAARNWPARQSALADLLAEAEREDRQVVLVATAPPVTNEPASLAPIRAADARAAVQALQPKPWPVDRQAVLARLKALSVADATSAFWLSDGVADGESQALATYLAERGSLHYLAAEPSQAPLLLIAGEMQANDLGVRVRSLPAPVPRLLQVRASAEDGGLLARQVATIEPGAKGVEVRLPMPSELRNRAARIEIEGDQSAGAVLLVDERWRRRPVGVAAATNAGGQPLLSENYYLERALGPFTEIRRGRPIDLLKRELAVLIFSDVGPDSPAEEGTIVKWIEAGGLLLRFAGPHLAEQADQLLPVRLRRGGRTIGGALSWEQPARLAPFAPDSPFAGLAVPADVTVSRQVLAEPDLDLAAKTWARLADGTPLVTAEKRGQGRIVLVHTTANADWSNLALSGLFVEMLRRTVAMSQGVATASEEALPPIETLDGFGRLQRAPPTARPISGKEVASAIASPQHPPGFYGTTDSKRALNLSAGIAELKPIASLPPGSTRESFPSGREIDLRPPLLTAALLLTLADLLIAYALRGLLGRRLGQPAAAFLFAVLGAASAARADDAFVVQATSELRLAYVRTGNDQVDTVSRAGLVGLTATLNRRTAVETADPLAVDIERDELIFFPLLYWPVVSDQAPPSSTAVERINRYLGTGGTILFDTRDGDDQTPGSFGGAALSAQRLRRLVGAIKIPTLVPIPPDHVLTKSFYLLHEFPGRWNAGSLWVEPVEDRVNDGVSSVVVGANDWAAAWAVDGQGRPAFAVVPGDESQREMAMRFGVNLVMYVLTGNYKSDQVHVPAILERLGQ